MDVFQSTRGTTLDALRPVFNAFITLFIALASITQVTKAEAQTIPPTTVNDVNYTSLYWNPAENGWGVHITHQGSVLFVALYTYDEDGEPLWMVCSNCGKQADNRTFTGDFFRVNGGTPFNVSPFTPVTSSNVSFVGKMTISFADAESGKMTYTVNGVTVAKQIEKQVFGTRTQCKFQDTFDRSKLTNYQDLWWNKAESGWGISFAHQDNILFAAMYVYGQTGRNEWYVMSRGDLQSDGSFIGDLYRARGPVFNAVPFIPITIANLTQVGTMQFKPSDGQTAVLTYRVNGQTIVKNIVRQEFALPANACSKGIPPKLIMSAGSGQANNGPASVFDLTTGSVQDLKNNAGGCDGASLNPVTQKVVISCRSGSQPYISYDPITGIVNLSALSLASQGTVNAPVVCASSGKCYYGFGIVDTSSVSNARILVTTNGIVEKTIPIPTNSVKVPVRMKVVGNTMWILSRGATGFPSIVSKFDLVTEQFVGNPIELGSDAWAMAVNENLVAVSISRNSAGKDVLIFDTTTSLQINSLTVPGVAGNFNAFGITIKGNNLYITEATRVSSYSISTFSQTGVAVLPSYGFEIASGANHIYAAVLETNVIYELDGVTLAVKRQWSKPVGSGRLYVAE